MPETQVAVVTPAPQPSAPPSPAQPAVGVYPDGMQPGEVFRDCPDCPEMVVVPSGSFTMGSPESETEREQVPDEYASRERPRHRVTIPLRFAVGRYEVTRGEFASFVGETGYDAVGECWYWTGEEFAKSVSKSWRNPGFSQTERDPVVCVSWDDAKAYVAWLGGKTGEEYRLLSESEWEYAARGGTSTSRYWGDDRGRACNYANGHDATSKREKGFSWPSFACDDGAVETSRVGSYSANAFGLYDVLGNVWEWVSDCWHESYTGAPADGGAWTTGGDCGRRVLRGGSWDDLPWSLRAANRDGGSTVVRIVNLGFRIARTF